MANLVILAQPKKAGFNRAIAEAAASAADARLIDLYADGFDPVMPEEEIPRKWSFDERTLAYQEALKASERLVFVHPDWWGGPPAILKGFLDRVLRPGVAYGFREADFKDSAAAGLLKGKRADVFITTDEPRPPEPDAWPPARVWKESVFAFCGIKDARVHVFWGLRDSGFAERKAWIERAKVIASDAFSASAPSA